MVLVVGVVLALAAGLAVVLVDVAAYALAAARAQGAADAAARAAVAITDPRGGLVGDAEADARALVEASGGQLRSCRCPPGAATATVLVRVPVPTLVLHRVAARAVDATATARLVAP